MSSKVEEAVQALEASTRALVSAEEHLAAAEHARDEAIKELDYARRQRLNAEQRIIEIIRTRVGGPGEKL